MMDGKQIKTSAREALCTPEGGLRAPVCFERVWRRAFVAAGSAMLSAALLLAGCSKEPAGGTEGERTAITVSATLPVGAAEASTKAVADGSTALTLRFTRADETSAGSYGAYGAEFTGTRAAGTGSRSLTFDPRQFYPLKQLNTRIIGWYPGGAAAAGNPEGFYDASTGTVCWSIDGGQDILFASAQGSTIAAMPVLVFNHRLAQIQFWPYAENAAAAAQWGPVKSITLLDKPDLCTMTLPDPATTEAGAFTATGNADFTVRNLPADNLPTTAKIIGDPVMIAPTTDNTVLNLIIGMADGKNLLVTVPERTYPAGSVTAVKLKFIPTEVQVEPAITISDWATAGELNAYPKVVNGNTIILSDYLGTADGTSYPMHEPWLVTPAHSESAWDANASGKNIYGEKFTVAKANAKGKDGSETMTWFEASGTTDATYNSGGYSACAQYSEASYHNDQGLWRLPTIRELKLIYDKKAGLTAANIPSDGPPYWSATGNSINSVYPYIVNSRSGNASEADRSDLYRVRCVRDEEALTLIADYPKVDNGTTFVMKDAYGAASPTVYPTHDEPWLVTPFHSESSWNANASGNNTCGINLHVASANANGKDGSAETMTWYEASGTTNNTYNPDGYSACSKYSEEIHQRDKGFWRLPTIRELKLIFDKESELTVAPPIEHKFYWSVTQKNASGSWGTYFDTGVTDGGHHGTYYVRCVRDEVVKESSAYPYVADNNTLVLKDVAGQAATDTYPIHESWLVTPAHSETAWDANASGKNTYAERFTVAKADAKNRSGSVGSMSWYEASGNNAYNYSACAEYSEEADQSDKGLWRLPTIRELRLIYDKKDELTAINIISSYYWSGTEYNSTTINDRVWYMSSSSGSITYYSKSYTSRVRCVKDL